MVNIILIKPLCILFFLEEINLSPYAVWDQTGITLAGWTNGTSGSSPSQLNRPLDIFITTNDVLYISDIENCRIIVVPLNANNDKFIIGPTLDSNTTRLGQAHGISIINTSLYVIDLSERRVQKLSLNGTNATTVPGLNELNSPLYLFVDDNNNIYLSDTDNHRMLLFFVRMRQMVQLLQELDLVDLERTNWIYRMECLSHRMETYILQTPTTIE